MTCLRAARAGRLAALLLLPGLTVAAGLNDTGVTQCADDSSNDLPCNNSPIFPRQDAETGRDAQVGLQKAGSGSAGFDFTKLDSNSAPLPADAISWDCVRDNVTGLVWEIKTNNNGLRDKDWTYTWCNNNASTNGGSAGTCDTGSSVGSDNCFNNARCDTEKYVQDINALNPALCGYSDWRMPTREELRTIVDYSRSTPAIDTTATGYFPQTVSDVYWSASPFAPGTGSAWRVHFYNGQDNVGGKFSFGAVRLVRGG